jgi:hypothetical protein
MAGKFGLSIMILSGNIRTSQNSFIERINFSEIKDILLIKGALKSLQKVREYCYVKSNKYLMTQVYFH